MNQDDRQRGLYGKYDVRKIDTGERVFQCFVLRPNKDEFSRQALAAYADACEGEYPALAFDLRKWLARYHPLSCPCGFCEPDQSGEVGKK